MKKIIYLILFLFLLSSCKKEVKWPWSSETKTEQSGGDYKNLPYPQIHASAKVGEYVLVPPAIFLRTLSAGNLDSIYLAFYPRKCIEVGDAYSKVQDYDTVLTVPNAFIIPIPAGQKAHKGDIVLTWWQGGSGMQRAYVTDATNPYKPEVKYLDFDWLWEDAQFKVTGQLDSNTFVVINKPFQPGSSVAYLNGGSYEFYKVINVYEDKVMAFSWSGKLAIFDKKECLPNEIHPQVQPGDSVFVPFYGIYTPAIVDEIKDGLVISEFDFFGKIHKVKNPICDIRKTLP